MLTVRDVFFPVSPTGASISSTQNKVHRLSNNGIRNSILHKLNVTTGEKKSIATVCHLHRSIQLWLEFHRDIFFVCSHMLIIGEKIEWWVVQVGSDPSRCRQHQRVQGPCVFYFVGIWIGRLGWGSWTNGLIRSDNAGGNVKWDIPSWVTAMYVIMIGSSVTETHFVSTHQNRDITT